MIEPNEIFRGQEAKEILDYLLKQFDDQVRYHAYPVTGYFKEENVFVCFDNTCFNCFVEPAKSEQSAQMWCRKEIESTELYLELLGN